jgi:hypothetical protein
VGSLVMESLLAGDMEDFQYPEWQKPFQDALVELDGSKLPERIAVAEAAILSRLQAMSGTGEHSSERRAIEDALSSLRVLRRESLRFGESARPSSETGSEE